MLHIHVVLQRHNLSDSPPWPPSLRFRAFHVTNELITFCAALTMSG